MKKVKIQLSFKVANDASQEEIATMIEKIFEPMKSSPQLKEVKYQDNITIEPDVDDIQVRFAKKNKVDFSGVSAGYESRIWEKVTCKMGDLDRIKDIITNPVINPDDTVINPGPEISVNVSKRTK